MDNIQDFLVRGDRLIEYKGNRRDVIIPDGIKFIDNCAFYQNNYLESIVIPDSVICVAELAFYGCYNLRSIKLGANVVSIGYKAFGNCYSLEHMVVPASVRIIDRDAFYNCVQPTLYCEIAEEPLFFTCDWEHDLGCQIVWGYNNITKNKDYDYVVHNKQASLTRYKARYKNLRIPATIDGYPVVRFGTIFAHNYDAEYIHIPQGIKAIDDYAFFACENLVMVNIPDSVTEIWGSAFKGCISLSSVQLPKQLKILDESVFEDCQKLIDIVVPDKVESIGGEAFLGCGNLRNIVIGEAVESISSDIFSHCHNLQRVIFVDESDWFYTNDVVVAFSKTGGTAMKVDNPKRNARLLKNTDNELFLYQQRKTLSRLTEKNNEDCSNNINISKQCLHIQQKISKAEAKQLCIKNNIFISSTITFVSSNDSASRKYWANPKIGVLYQDWTLILNDKTGKKLHIFRIPAGSIDEGQLKTRSDNDDLIDLRIFYNDESFKDSRSHLSFAPWYIQTISY